VEAAALNGGDSWLAGHCGQRAARRCGNARRPRAVPHRNGVRLGTIGFFGRGTDALHPELVQLVEGLVAQIAQYLLRRKAEDDFNILPPTMR